MNHFCVHCGQCVVYTFDYLVIGDSNTQSPTMFQLITHTIEIRNDVRL